MAGSVRHLMKPEEFEGGRQDQAINRRPTGIVSASSIMPRASR